MKALQCFSLKIEDYIAHLVHNRPEVMNTMNPNFWHELEQSKCD